MRGRTGKCVHRRQRQFHVDQLKILTEPEELFSILLKVYPIIFLTYRLVISPASVVTNTVKGALPRVIKSVYSSRACYATVKYDTYFDTVLARTLWKKEPVCGIMSTKKFLRARSVALSECAPYRSGIQHVENSPASHGNGNDTANA